VQDLNQTMHSNGVHICVGFTYIDVYTGLNS